MPCARRTPGKPISTPSNNSFSRRRAAPISRESVQGYVTWLEEMKFSPSTINQRLAAVRKLAAEARRCGYVDSETAQAIVTVAGVKQKGRRLGRWLAWEEARTLLQAPNPHSIRGMRDRAPLAGLVACALRRGELSRMNCEHLAMRDGRWVFLDFLGKGKQDALGGRAAVGKASD
jgi:integrase/recombinase XerD